MQVAFPEFFGIIHSSLFEHRDSLLPRLQVSNNRKRKYDFNTGQYENAQHGSSSLPLPVARAVANLLSDLASYT